ncbi:MAG TPA: tyrosine-type recombinase/integrase [Xanthobacteraceae bacterium]|jgi:integrase
MTREKYLSPRITKGRAYLYFRHPSGKLISLPTDQSSSEFELAYDAALRSIEPAAAAPVARIDKQDKSNVAAAIDRYLDSSKFDKVKPTTQKRYCDALKILRDGLGAVPLRDLKTASVDAYSEEIIKQGRGKAAADLQTQMIGLIFKVCCKYPEFGVADLHDPTENAERHYTVKHAHRAWSDEVLEKVLTSAPEHMRLAIELLWLTGQRGGDVVKMRWADFKAPYLFVRPEKTGGDAAAAANQHEIPQRLIDRLNATPRRSEFILTKSTGEPWENANLLGKAVRRELLRVGLRDAGLSMHGLRVRAAEDAAKHGGIDGAQSVTGHKSSKMAAYYARNASTLRTNSMTVKAWNVDINRHSWLPQIVGGTDRKAG